MRVMAHALEREGFRAHEFAYPSLRKSLAEIVERLNAELAGVCANGEKACFVGHSLGGLVVRAYAQAYGIARIGRVVMLGTPNRGSEVVDHLRRQRWLRPALGPVAGLLGTSDGDLPAMLGPVGFETGVIAGNASINPWFSRMMPGPDDGMVAVERTKVAGMKDFIVVPRNHTFMMNAADVHRQTIAFLRNGRFEKAPIEERVDSPDRCDRRSRGRSQDRVNDW